MECGVIDVAGGTVTDEGVIVLGAPDEGGEGDWHGGLEVGEGEGCRFLAEADKLGAEIRVVEPPIEGAASDAGVASTLGVGGCGGDDRERRELTRGKVTPRKMCAILCLCVPFQGFGVGLGRARSNVVPNFDYGGDNRLGRHFTGRRPGINFAGRKGAGGFCGSEGRWRSTLAAFAAV